MQINVAQLLKEPVGAKRSYDIDEFAGENTANHVTGVIGLIRTNHGILLMGKLSAEINGTCARCLRPAQVRVTLNLEEEYFPVVDINTGFHLKHSSEEFTLSDKHILDLDEALRQYIITATPTKLLCKPDCQGLCPVCGKEVAAGDCGHRNKSYDHRWDKLVQRKKESKV